MHRILTPLRGAALALLVLTLFAGCSHWPGQRTHRGSSVVSFVYPHDHQPSVSPASPELSLPLRIGIAMAPATRPQSDGFTAEEQHRLLESLAADFRALPFVHSIEIIPDGFLRPGGGFANLDQVRSLLGIDVVVLVGYDQAQFTENTGYSLAYWTIVGAYLVHGNRNDTHTLMEASVYDIASRSLLLRATGTNQTSAGSDLINVDRKLRRDSGRSFAAASAALTANLHRELELFKERVREGRSEARIVHRPGYAGGGALTPLAAGGALLGLLGGWLARRRSHCGQVR